MFSEFAEEIRNLSPTGPTERELQNFLLDDSGKIRVYYAPFDWINAEPRLIVVGITPEQRRDSKGGKGGTDGQRRDRRAKAGQTEQPPSRQHSLGFRIRYGD
jgi:hypothetical protein